MRGWRRWAAAVAAVAAVTASAYFWWWKPFVIASLRFAVETALAGTQPRVTFRTLDLRGLSTLVLRDVAAGSLDDDNSVNAREVRLSLDLWALVRRRFDVAAALRKVEFVRPQVVIAWPEALRPSGAAPAVPLPAQASFAVSDGRILLRARKPRTAVLTIHDVDATLALTPAGSWSYSISLTPPESPRHGLHAAGTWGHGSLVAAVKASRVRPAPLIPWLEPVGLPFRLEGGSLSASLELSFTRSGRKPAWDLVRADGRLDAEGVTVVAPGLPMPVRDLTGRARSAGTKVSLEKVMFTTSRTAWIAGGSVEGFRAPKLHLEVGAPAFALSLAVPGASGSGPVRARAEGPASAPVITAVFDLANAEAGGISATRATGTLTVEKWGRHVQLEDGRFLLPAGILTCAGAGTPRAASADATFAFVPADALLPRLSGALTLRAGELKYEVKTGDGIWTLRGRGRRRGGVLAGSLTGSAEGGARCSLNGTFGIAAPHRLDATAELAGAGFGVLYLERRNGIFLKLPLTLTAAITARGTAADPAVTANLAGSRLALGRTPMAVTGTLRFSRRLLELVSVRAGSVATLGLRFPLEPGETPASARITGEGFPLKLAWTLVPVSDEVRDLEGAFHGTVDVADLSGRPTIEGTGEIRNLAWRETRLGTLGFTVEERDRTMRLTALSIRGPACAAAGEGSVTVSDAGWEGSARLNVAHFKAGTTDLDGHAEVAGGKGRKGITATVRLTSLRMNAAAYQDAEVAISVPEPGTLSVKASWEDTLSAVWESREGKSVSLSASCTELALPPLLGMFRIPAPIDALTGTLSLRGSPDRASLKADLRWPRGEVTARGWISVPVPSAGSLTINASDRAVAAWLPFLREVVGLKNLPELDGSLGTRGFAAEWAPGRMDVNGWVSVRDGSVRGRGVGSGSVRIRREGTGTEVEGSVSGDAGEFRIHPTRITVAGDERTVAGAFSWSKVPTGKAVCALARGTLEMRRRGTTSTGTLALTGLSLDDLTAPDLVFRFEGDPSSWSLSSPRESAWQAIGTVATPGGRISVLPDERTGGRWVVLKGPDGAQVKVAGTWPLPNAPEKLAFEGHRLRAAPLLVAIGAPVQEGVAEADLTYTAAATPPLSGRISLTNGSWGGFEYDLFELKGTGEPGRGFKFTGIRVERAGVLKARGTGSLTLVPERTISLDLSVERLALRYLKPFGFVEGGDSGGLGRLTVSGDFEDPDIRGSLVCTPGTYTPPTGFAELRLVEGRLDFKGRSAILTATLNDVAGAAVLVAGEASFAKLVPTSYTVSMTAPTWIHVDGLPRLYKGLAKGRMRLEGTPADPVLRGEVIVQQGRMQTPPKVKNPDPQAFAERVDWDLRVDVGEGVSYAVEPVAGAALDVARLDPKSYLHVKGKGAGFEVFGEVLADSGPVTLIMGKQLYRKEAPR